MNQQDPSKEVSLHSSGQIYKIAAAAALGHYPANQCGQIGLIFSWCAVEAALNDLLDLCGTAIAGSQLSKLAKIAIATDPQHRASVNQKIKLIAVFFGKEAILEEYPFSGLRLLVEIRNSIIHLRPERINLSKPTSDWNIVQKIINLNILSLEDKGSPVSLNALVSDPTIARWSYQVAKESIRAVVAMLPDDPVKKMMRFTGPQE